MTPAAGTTSRPSGLPRAEASLATNLVGATPTVQVSCCSSQIRARIHSAICAGRPEPPQRAAHVEEGLVERERFDERGDRTEDLHDPGGRLAVAAECRAG